MLHFASDSHIINDKWISPRQTSYDNTKPHEKIIINENKNQINASPKLLYKDNYISKWYTYTSLAYRITYP